MENAKHRFPLFKHIQDVETTIRLKNAKNQ